MSELTAANDEGINIEQNILSVGRNIEQLNAIEESNNTLEQLRRQVYLLQLYLDKALNDVLLKKEYKMKSFFETNRYVKHSTVCIEKAIRSESEVDMVELRQYDSTDGKDALLGSEPGTLESIYYNLTEEEIEESEKTAMEIIKNEVIPSYCSRHDELATRIETGLERKLRLSHAVKSEKNTYFSISKRKFDDVY